MEIIQKQAMLKPCHRNNTLITSILNKTFPERRGYITEKDNIKNVSELKTLYPLLFDLKNMMEEFHRLMEINPIRLMEEELGKVEDRLLLLPSRKKEHQMLVGLRTAIFEENDAERRNCKYNIL